MAVLRMKQTNLWRVLRTVSGMEPFAECSASHHGRQTLGAGAPLRNSCPGIFQCGGIEEEGDAQFWIPALRVGFHYGRGEWENNSIGLGEEGQCGVYWAWQRNLGDQRAWAPLGARRILTKLVEELCNTSGFLWLEFQTCALPISVVPCPVPTVASWPAYRFLRGQVRWSGIPISLRTFLSLLWST